MASQLTSYLPPGDGWLPKWLLMVSVIAIGNSIQAYTSLGPTQRVYNGIVSVQKTAKSSPSKAAASSASPVNPLSARTFGTWTFLSAIIRLYAAYNVNDEKIYQLAFWTYCIAFAHFSSEWLIFRSSRVGPGLAGPVIVSTVSMVWMWAQWGYYVG